MQISTLLAALKTVVALALAALVMVGCSPPTPEAIVRAARAEIEAGRYAQAIVSLKQAIQAEPNLPEARFLLGSAMLRAGDPVAAEVELRKARELKYDTAVVVPPIAGALLEQGQDKKLLDEFGSLALSDPKAQTALDFHIATALSHQGDRAASRAVVDRLLVRDPKHAGARLLKARLMVGTVEASGAVPLVEGVLSQFPQNAEAWQVLGDIKMFDGADLPGAVLAFRKVIEIAPQAPLAHAAIGTTLLYQHDISGAERQLAAMKIALPKHIETRFLDANISFAKEDFVRARVVAQDLVKLFPTGFRVLQFAGAVELKLGSLKQAENYLTRALQSTASDPYVRRLLAQVFLRSGQTAKVFNILSPLLQSQVADAAAQMLAGDAYLLEGDLKRAEDIFKLAAANAPNDPQVKLSLALSEFVRGNNVLAISQLEALAATDRSSAPDKALISAHLRMGKYAAALSASEQLVKKLPGKPEPEALAGRSLMGLGKKDEARQRFELAVSKDPLYFPAVASLAMIDLADQKPGLAAQRFESVLKTDPRNVMALLALADLRARAGKPKDEVVKLLGDAVRADPANVSPRLHLIDFLRLQRDTKGALAIAKEANAAMPDRPEILDVLGEVLALDGETNQALAVFRRLAAMQPKSGVPYLKIADVQQVTGDSKSAVVSLRRAVELEPDLLAAQKNLIALLRKLDQRPQAYLIAKTLQTHRPDDSSGFIFEGDIAAEAKEWSRAATAYRAGLGKSRGVSPSSRLYIALMRGNKAADAEAFAKDRLKANPKDVGLIFQLGQVALENDQLPLAEQRFLQVVELEPSNALALNNAAFALARQGKNGGVALAERALASSPKVASFMDTLALALATEGQLEKAVEMQRQAVRLEPGSPGFSFNLAKLLFKAGDRAGARTELEKLEKATLVPVVRDEVKRLLLLV